MVCVWIITCTFTLGCKSYCSRSTVVCMVGSMMIKAGTRWNEFKVVIAATSTYHLQTINDYLTTLVAEVRAARCITANNYRPLICLYTICIFHYLIQLLAREACLGGWWVGVAGEPVQVSYWFLLYDIIMVGKGRGVRVVDLLYNTHTHIFFPSLNRGFRLMHWCNFFSPPRLPNITSSCLSCRRPPVYWGTF